MNDKQNSQRKYDQRYKEKIEKDPEKLAVFIQKRCEAVKRHYRSNKDKVLERQNEYKRSTRAQRLANPELQEKYRAKLRIQEQAISVSPFFILNTR